MAYTLFFLFLFLGIFFYFLFKVRTFIARERAGSAELEANLTMLHLEMQKQHQKKQAAETEPPTGDIQQRWGYPPEKGRVIAVVNAGGEAPEGWDFAIRLHPEAENYLGAGLYKSLEKRVATLPGVDKCLLKEKELLLLRSSTFSEEIVVDLFWREFLHAAEVAQAREPNRR